MRDPFGDTLPTLTTDRLRLRHPTPDDTDALFAIFSDPVAMRYWSTEPMAARSQAVSYIDDIHAGLADRSLFQWAITEPEHDRLIGTVTVFAWSRQNRRAELGYMLSPAMQRRGFATEAVGAVIGFGFQQMNLHRFEADVHPDNLASIRLLLRLGFTYEGRLRDRWLLDGIFSDSVLYGLLRPPKPKTRRR